MMSDNDESDENRKFRQSIEALGPAVEQLVSIHGLTHEHGWLDLNVRFALEPDGSINFMDLGISSATMESEPSGQSH